MLHPDKTTQGEPQNNVTVKSERRVSMSGSAEPRFKLFAALVAGRGNEPEILAQVEEATRLGAKSGRIVPLVATPKIVVALAPSPPQVLPRPSALSWPRASVARSANAPLGSSAAVALKAGRCGYFSCSTPSDLSSWADGRTRLQRRVVWRGWRSMPAVALWSSQTVLQMDPVTANTRTSLAC